MHSSAYAFPDFSAFCNRYLNTTCGWRFLHHLDLALQMTCELYTAVTSLPRRTPRFGIPLRSALFHVLS